MSGLEQAVWIAQFPPSSLLQSYVQQPDAQLQVIILQAKAAVSFKASEVNKTSVRWLAQTLPFNQRKQLSSARLGATGNMVSCKSAGPECVS